MEQWVLWPQGVACCRWGDTRRVVLQRIQSQSGNVPAAFDKHVRFQDLLGARVVETVVDLVWLGCGNCDACAPRPYGVDIGWACSALWPEGLGQMTLLKNNCTWFNTLLNYYELLLIIIACYCTFGYIWPSGQAKHQAERHAGTKSIHKPLMEPGGATLRGFGGVHWQVRHGATWPKAVEKPCKKWGGILTATHNTEPDLRTSVQLGPTQQCTDAVSRGLMTFPFLTVLGSYSLCPTKCLLDSFGSFLASPDPIGLSVFLGGQLSVFLGGHIAKFSQMI